MSEIWYPIKRERQTPSEVESEYLKAKRSPKKVLCYVCIGHGMVVDAKSGKLRDCVACKSTGRIQARKR